MKRKLFLCFLVLTFACAVFTGCWDSGDNNEPTPPTPAESDAALLSELNGVIADYDGSLALYDADSVNAVISAAGYSATSIVTKEEGAYLLFDTAAGKFVLAKAENGAMKVDGNALAANQADFSPEALYSGTSDRAMLVISGNSGDSLIEAVNAVRNFADTVYSSASAAPDNSEIENARVAVDAKINALDLAKETLSARFHKATFANRYGSVVLGTEAVIFSQTTNALTKDTFDGLTLSDYDNITVPASVKAVDGAFDSLAESTVAFIVVNDSAMKSAVEAEAAAAGLPALVKVNDGGNMRGSEFANRFAFNRDTILRNLDYINSQMLIDGKQIAELVISGLNEDGSFNVDVNIFDAKAEATSLYNTVNAALSVIQKASGRTATIAPYGYTYEQMTALMKEQGAQDSADYLLENLNAEAGANASATVRRQFAAKYGKEFDSFEELAYAFFCQVYAADRAGVDAKIAEATDYATLPALIDYLAGELGAESADAYIAKVVADNSDIYVELELETINLTTLANQVVISLYVDPTASFSEARGVFNAMQYVDQNLKEMVKTMEKFITYCKNRITVLAEVEASESQSFEVAYHFVFHDEFKD